jgi:hypothetical protein
VVVFQFEQGKLPRLRSLPGFALLAAQFRKPPPAEGVPIDQKSVFVIDWLGDCCGIPD